MKGKLSREEKAQLSIELIIVLAAVVAIVLVLVSQLQKTSTSGAKKIDDKTKEIFDKIDEID
ncbi:MAG: hypothetical protein J4478_04195 [Candidatus Diapherotrites archaeon]|uniref:Class III signal peptide-containing protein n=1 Tax=Candidatus Iainarchaeum sp. TaxID=3101447 RepID=A0A7J4KSH0_9ARCH|nr:hypothetical protein [Candidatus Diapherotrites archaeon]HIH21047.1 hypothetical protein [Candidatus Diapherotrites archaeon]HIH32644.1 hypothetical protein [Candidatus Diapherotrites archaeon]